jgi:hypothetical protein
MFSFDNLTIAGVIITFLIVMQIFRIGRAEVRELQGDERKKRRVPR